MSSVNIKRVDDKINISLQSSQEVSLTVQDARHIANELLQHGIDIEGIADKVGPWKRLPMQFIAFNTICDGRECAVEFWICQQTERNALIIAEYILEGDGHEIETLEEHFETDLSDYNEDPDRLKYYKQAIIDNEVVVYYEKR